MDVVIWKCGEMNLHSTQKCGSIHTFKLTSETWLIGIPYVHIYPLWYTKCHLLAYTYTHWHCTKLAHNF